MKAHTATARTTSAMKCKAVQKEKFSKLVEKQEVLGSSWVANLSDGGNSAQMRKQY